MIRHSPVWNEQVADLSAKWAEFPRWDGVKRPYSPDEVIKLRGTVQIDYTLARLGAARLWHLLHNEPYVRALGALTGNQAVQQVEAGLKAIYLSGWQVAGDANSAWQMYPDQSLYPVDSVPQVLRKINNALLRADQIQHMNGSDGVHYLAPIVADAEAGFGGPLNAFELVKAMIEAGAAGIHLEDQLSSAKKCGHMGGKVLVPISEFIQKLIAARLAADVLDVETIIIGRTDAGSANLLRGDCDEVDRQFLARNEIEDGFYSMRGGLEYAIARALAFAPYCDLIWCETQTPNLDEASEFANAIHAEFPGKMLAYNCSPSFNWKLHLGEREIAEFQDRLGELGYKFQFVTLAGFHTLNASMFDLAYDYARSGMAAYSQLQQREIELEQRGYRALKHQSFVGAGYFDKVQTVIGGGKTATCALEGSTEQLQFEDRSELAKEENAVNQ